MKKSVNITTESGKAAITAELDAVQKNCTARTINLTDILVILHNVEVNLGVSKAALNGTTVQYTGARQFPNSYKYQPDSTHFSATHNGRTWYVTSISRAACPDRLSNTSVIMSETTKSAVLKQLSEMRI